VILEDHFNAIEKLLICQAEISGNSGHSLHKGTPREAFVREFLYNHLPETIAFGTGEVFDLNTKSENSRNQNDIVLYKKNYPKINFGGGIDGFFVESVVSTIEIKSKLTEEEFIKALNSIKNTKSLTSNIIEKSIFKVSNEFDPKGILSCIVAYSGPAKMKTILGWLKKYIAKNKIDFSPINGKIFSEKMNLINPIVDIIVILGVGVILFDSVSGIYFIEDSERQANTSSNWVVVDQNQNNIFVLFTFLTNYIIAIRPNILDILKYMNKTNNKFDKRQFH
jgi:hypothetical protein